MTRGHETAAALDLLLRGQMSRWDLAADIVDPPGLRWKRDPVGWAQQRAGVAELWSKQGEILEAVRDHNLVAVHSCHEVGKSFTAGVTACWWLDVHPPGTAFVLSTAPTQPQVQAILWREINRLHARAGLLGRTNLTEWYIGNELVAFGRKPSDTDPGAFQGHHARYFLLIFDEACGIPKGLWDAGASLVANEHSRWLAIGNPDDPHGEFADNCGVRGSTAWHTIKIGYQDTPAFTGERVSRDLLDQLISKRWVEERREKWGEKSALFISKCEGNFPLEASPFTVMPLPWLELCRWLELPVPTSAEVEAGIDVGAGGDRTVIAERVGPRAGRVLEFVDPDPERTVGQLVHTLREWRIQRVKVDSAGIGWGIYGALASAQKEGLHAAEVVPVNFGAGPTPGLEDRFLNKRAEVWWQVGRENTRRQLWDLGQLDEDTLGELATPLYQILDRQGRIKIQPKEEVIKEWGRSPDRADAVLLAFTPAVWDLVVEEIPEDVPDLTADLEPGAYGLEGAWELERDLFA